MALSVDIDHGGGVYYCHRCGLAGWWSEDCASVRHGAAPIVKPPSRHLVLAAHFRAFWQSLALISGTAEKYLGARACVLPPPDGDLRCSEALQHPSGYVGPALVALVTDALTGEPLTLHRTWIKAGGDKADVEPPRLLLGKHRKQGGVIRLWPNEAITSGLTIAEGIETALTAAELYPPAWSLIDAGNLGTFPVLNGIESLLVVADHDPAGLSAADRCADRWYRAGREVNILKPPVPGQDLNDYARAA